MTVTTIISKEFTNDVKKGLYPHIARNFPNLNWTGMDKKLNTDSLKKQIKDKKIILPKKQRLIGSGAFGSAYGVDVKTSKGTNKEMYVVKVMMVSNNKSVKNKAKIESKLAKGKSSSSWRAKSWIYGNVVFNNNAYIIILMDHVMRGYSQGNKLRTLHSYLDTYGVTPSLVYNVFITLKAMYSNPFVHGDLHGDNILVIHNKSNSNVNRVRIIDFDSIMHDPRFTYKYNMKLENRILNSHKRLFNRKLKKGLLEQNGYWPLTSTVPVFLNKKTSVYVRRDYQLLKYLSKKLYNQVIKFNKIK